MEITFEERGDRWPGGRLVARDGDVVAGEIRWRDDTDADGPIRRFDLLHVVEGYRGRHLGGALTEAAKVRREADGVTRWVASPMTEAGRRAVDAHVARNYEEDPRG